MRKRTQGDCWKAQQWWGYLNKMHAHHLSYYLTCLLSNRFHLGSQDISRIKGQVITPALLRLLNFVCVSTDHFLTIHVGEDDPWLKFQPIRNVHNKNFTQGCLLFKYEKIHTVMKPKEKKKHQQNAVMVEEPMCGMSSLLLCKIQLLAV